MLIRLKCNNFNLPHLAVIFSLQNIIVKNINIVIYNFLQAIANFRICNLKLMPRPHIFAADAPCNDYASFIIYATHDYI